MLEEILHAPTEPMTRRRAADPDGELRRAALAEYWRRQHTGLMTRVKPLVLDRLMDRPQVVTANHCLMAATSLLTESIFVSMLDEDTLATQMLDTAEFYLRTAIERDELGAYARAGQIRVGQEELGRAERLKLLTVVRWIRNQWLDTAALRQAIQMKRKWNEAVFSTDNWREMDWSLAEWMAEYIILEEFDEAVGT